MSRARGDRNRINPGRSRVTTVRDIDIQGNVTDEQYGGGGDGTANADTGVVVGTAAPGASVTINYRGSTATAINYTNTTLIDGDNVLVLSAGTLLAVVGLARTGGSGGPTGGTEVTAGWPIQLNANSPIGGISGSNIPYAWFRDLGNSTGIGTNSVITADTDSLSLVTRVYDSTLSSTSVINFADTYFHRGGTRCIVNNRLTFADGYYDPATNSTVSYSSGNNSGRNYITGTRYLQRLWRIQSSSANDIGYITSANAEVDFTAGLTANVTNILQSRDHVWAQTFGSGEPLCYKPNDTSTAFVIRARTGGAPVLSSFTSIASDGSLWQLSGTQANRFTTTGIYTTSTPPWATWAGVTVNSACPFGTNTFLIGGKFDDSVTGDPAAFVAEWTIGGSVNILWADTAVIPAGETGHVGYISFVNNKLFWTVFIENLGRQVIYEATVS